MKTQQENGYQSEQRKNTMTEDDTSKAYSNGDNTQGSQFIARVTSLPILQEGLSATQSLASQYKLGRALLNQTHSLVQSLNSVIHKTQETPTYRHIFRSDGHLKKLLDKADGYACFSLDFVETKTPFIQQSTATIVNTLIVRPRQNVREKLGRAVDMAFLQPFSNAVWNINKGLDGLESWMQQRDLLLVAKGHEIDHHHQSMTGIHQRLAFLSGATLNKAVVTGKLQATVIRDHVTQWSRQYPAIHDSVSSVYRLTSQRLIPLVQNFKSQLDTSLAKWVHLTKTQSSA